LALLSLIFARIAGLVFFAFSVFYKLEKLSLSVNRSFWGLLC